MSLSALSGEGYSAGTGKRLRQSHDFGESRKCRYVANDRATRWYGGPAKRKTVLPRIQSC